VNDSLKGKIKMTHSEAVGLVHGKTKRSFRKIGNNTIGRILDDSSVGIMLYDTYVVKIHPDDSYTLNSGGFYSNTTKNRINDYSPIKVFQNKGDWFIWSPKDKSCFPFQNGMRVSDKPNFGL
jgi:hypothetical protein